MPNLSELPAIFYAQLGLVFILFLAVGVVFLYIKDYLDRKKYLNFEEKLINQNLDKSFSLLNETIRKTQTKIYQAEQEEIKTLSEAKSKIEQFEDQYQKKLEQTISESQHLIVSGSKQITEDLIKSFNQYQSRLETFNQLIEENIQQLKSQINSSEKDFTQFLSDLKEKSIKSQTINEEEVKKRIDSLFNGVEDRISDYLIKSEQRMMMAIELELKSARQLIDTYKVQQLQIIDENIVAILEKTMNLVLKEKLTLKDQLDLVYQSLERAKADKIII